MYSTKIAVSVVDNVLLVHQVDAKVVILYDLFSNSQAPISAPLPLLLRGLSRATASSSSQISSTQAPNVELTEVGADVGIIYGDGWTFLVPDLICDVSNGTLWRIHLDLEVWLLGTVSSKYLLLCCQKGRRYGMKYYIQLNI